MAAKTIDAHGHSKTATSVVRYQADWTAGPARFSNRPASRPSTKSTVD